LQMHLLSAFAEFERDRIRERIHLGLDRARKQGKKLGRRARAEGEPLTVRQAAALWGCSKSQAARRLSRGEVPPAPASAAA
jgi:putative DNA-invertase from lambdoid prophage Rac